MTQVFLKDPNAVKDFVINWATFLGSDTISTSAWTVPTGIVADSNTNTTTTATVWLSGGTAGTSYAVSNRIVTAAGRTEDAVIVIRVHEETSAQYCKVLDVKTQRGITSNTDDALIVDLILAVDKAIDRISGWQSFAPAADATKRIDADSEHIDGATLILDYPLCSITSVTNGDAVVVSSSNYVTIPADAPYYALKLKTSSGLYWTYTTDAEQAIAIVGKWGYSSTCPEEIKRLAIEATILAYNVRASVDTETVSSDNGTSTVVPRDVLFFITRRLGELGLIRL